MYQQGDLIVYGNTGVCRVEAVGHPQGISGIPEDKLYYTLAPLYSAGVIYAPLDTPVLMRPVLTREAAEKLISPRGRVLHTGPQIFVRTLPRLF